MKRLFVVLILQCCFIAVSFSQGLLDEAQRSFELGDYTSGQASLTTALRSAVTPEEKAVVLAELARFYDQLVGDIPTARQYWVQIYKQPLPADHVEAINARKHIENALLASKKYKSEDQVLDEIAHISGDLKKANENIFRLEEILVSRPDYIRRAQVYYWLGKQYETKKQYFRAAMAFDQALKLKPAIGRILPIESSRHIAYLKVQQKIIPIVAWSFIPLMLILLVVLAVKSKKTCNIKALKKRAVVMFLAWVFVFLALNIILFFSDFSTNETPYKRPLLVKTLCFQPGGMQLVAIFGYGLVLGISTFLMAIGLKRVRSRAWRICVMLVVVLSLSCALIAQHWVFFLSKGSFYLSNKGGGTFYTLLEMNETDLPNDKEVIMQMIANATPEERERLLKHNLKASDFKTYADKSIEELADMLMDSLEEK